MSDLIPFRTRLAVLVGIWEEFPDGSAAYSTEEVDILLASEGMQKLRQAFKGIAEERAGYWGLDPREWLEEKAFDLDEYLIDWILDE